MRFLYSNFPPMKTKDDNFIEAFYDLAAKSKEVDIAVGYITADSLTTLQKFTEYNKSRIRIKLIIGMHYFDSFTINEYNTAKELNDYLQRNDCGEVRLVTPFRFHGKLYSYVNETGPFAGIIGSNNLSSIVEGGSRVYEAAVLLDEPEAAEEINGFINGLEIKASDNISDVEIKEFKKGRSPLEGQEYVRRTSTVELANCIKNLTNTTFEIPIKTAEKSPQSNLNVFFGRGRQGKNGLIKPRHWYEVELIVPKNITSGEGYPVAKTENASFDVVTDDGWSFRCKVSGDYSKNFRSENDLKILGKWLKGRLEESGALTVGTPVTQETLTQYGRDTFTLTKTKTDHLWYLDFGVGK